MGLCSAGPHGVSLKDAHDKALDARKLLRAGTDPITIMGKDAREKRDRTIPTFGAFADDYIAAHRPKFRNEKHAAQWEMTLGEAYCKAIRSKPVMLLRSSAAALFCLVVLGPQTTEAPAFAQDSSQAQTCEWLRNEIAKAQGLMGMSAAYFSNPVYGAYAQASIRQRIRIRGGTILETIKTRCQHHAKPPNGRTDGRTYCAIKSETYAISYS